MKTCTKCQESKPESEFYETQRNGKPYRLPSCRQCFADYYTANQERQRLSNRRASIKRRYDLELEEYEALIAGGCSVCSRPGRVVLDHCHVTNSVRAPLCDACNLTLGGAGDDPAILRSLADYLERHAA